MAPCLRSRDSQTCLDIEKLGDQPQCICVWPFRSRVHRKVKASGAAVANHLRGMGYLLTVYFGAVLSCPSSVCFTAVRRPLAPIHVDHRARRITRIRRPSSIGRSLSPTIPACLARRLRRSIMIDGLSLTSLCYLYLFKFSMTRLLAM